MWVIGKPSALAGGVLAITNFLPGFDAPLVGFTLKPCVHYSAADADLYIVDNSWTYGAGMPTVRVSRITGPAATPAWVSDGFVASPGVAPALNFAFLNAAQAGAPAIATNDARIGSEPKFRNGRIWYACAGGLPAVGVPDRVSSFWYALTPSVPPVVFDGGVSDGGAGVFRFFPSLAVNANDDMCMGFTQSHAGISAEACVQGRDGTDPAGTLGALTTYKVGEAPYFKDFGTGSNRWGDYSATCVDPTDDLTVWTLQEYASTPVGGISRWGTWWAVHAPANTVAAVCPPDPPTAECAGAGGTNVTLDYTVSDSSGAALDVEITVDGTVEFTQSFPDTSPAPSGGAVSFAFAYDLGVHIVVMTVQNPSGGIATCTNTVTVADTTPPALSCSVARPVLWSPTKGLIDVFLNASALDACDGAPRLDVSVLSDEAAGVGVYSPDATLTGTPLRLRAERSSAGNGRVYLIVLTATDASGNATTGCCTVTVPLNLTAAAIVAVQAEAAAAAAACPAPGGYVGVLPVTCLSGCP
jgi:hypothetical protein